MPQGENKMANQDHKKAMSEMANLEKNCFCLFFLLLSIWTFLSRGVPVIRTNFCTMQKVT